jgi:hypothetical protein
MAKAPRRPADDGPLPAPPERETRIPVVPQRRRCWRYKLLHLSFAEALGHAKYLRWLDRQRGRDQCAQRVVIYFCTLHQAWHVGHDKRVGVPPAAKEGGPDGHPKTTVEAPKLTL